MHHNDPTHRGREKGNGGGRDQVTTSEDAMTPGELTGKWENRERQTRFLYLSTSESEESLSSDLEAEEEQGEGGVGWEEERVNHA